MKRILCLLLALCLLLPVVAMADDAAKLGVAYTAGHGNGIMVASVVVADGVIVDAYIDEIYFTAANDDYVLLPYASELGKKDDDVVTVAISKRENHEVYSAHMVENGGLDIADSYGIYQAFVIGKTIEELEAAVEGYNEENKRDFNDVVNADVDAVSSVTMVDTLLYVNALLAAAHNAQ